MYVCVPGEWEAGDSTPAKTGGVVIVQKALERSTLLFGIEKSLLVIAVTAAIPTASSQPHRLVLNNSHNRKRGKERPGLQPGRAEITLCKELASGRLN